MVGRPSGTRTLDVWMNGELVGHWSVSGPQEKFRYNEAWADSPFARPLSLSLPLAGRELSGEAVSNYFANLLPDSKDILKRVAARFRARSTGSFDLLEAIGRDCAGAIQLLPHDSERPHFDVIEAVDLSTGDVERMLDHTLDAPDPHHEADEEDLRISIAGAQEKTALLKLDGRWCRPVGSTPTTHILKLPLGMVGRQRADFSTSVENEWLCLELARACGFAAAKADIEHFGKHKALVVERFDRRFEEENGRRWIARLPQEDFCQVFGLPPGAKYENEGGPGMDAILDKLRGSEDAASDRANFLAAQLLFWMMAAPDGHAKNFSVFIEPQGRYRLTPLYDVMSAWPIVGEGPNMFQWKKLKLAMAVKSANPHYKIAEIQPGHWLAVADRNNVAGFDAALARLVDAVPKAVHEVASRLPAGFPARVSDSIFTGLLEQTRHASA